MKNRNTKVNVICAIAVIALVVGIAFVSFTIGKSIVSPLSANDVYGTQETITVYTTQEQTTTKQELSTTDKQETTEKQNIEDDSNTNVEKTIEEKDDNLDYDVDEKLLTVADNGDIIYKIQKGDTLSYISSVFGYSVDELAEYNQIKNVNLIYSNSSIRIPSR